MSTYDQWRRAADKGNVSRLVWSYGSESILLKDVISSQMSYSAANEFDQITISATDSRALSDALWTPPLYSDTSKHVLVLEAQQAASQPVLAEWLEAWKEHPHTWVTLISDETDIPYLDEDKTLLPSFWNLLAKKGRIVRCSPLTEKSSISWIHRTLVCSDGEALYIYQRSSGNLRIIKTLCAKITALEATPSKGLVDILSSKQSSGEFVKDILQDNKQAALLSLPAESEIDAILSLLSSRLGVMEHLYSLLVKRSTMKEAATEVPMFFVKDFFYSSKNYPPAAVHSRRILLKELSALSKRGGASSALLLLVSLW